MSSNLPVLIAGAGPCGLTAALTLKRQGVPFVIIERARRDKVCANVGSGYDLAPTAVDILLNRLQLEGMNTILSDYGGICLQDMQGNVIRELPIKEMTKNIKFLSDEQKHYFGTVNRTDLQNMLLRALFQTPSSEEGILRCGAGVASYETTTTDENSTIVTVTLSDGSTVEGSVLLACDGIHSAIRKQLHRNRTDELHFCDSVCYWGKCNMPEGSELEKQLQSAAGSSGTSYLWFMGDSKYPGTMMAGPCNKQLIWALIFAADVPPGERTDDLTRRGGRTLDEKDKAKLLKRMKGRAEILKVCLEATPAEDITEAGFFDRKDNSLPYMDESRHVVLLGDAAHPQSPFMGQGCNMAVVDAYVVATRLVQDSNIPEALTNFDSEERKKSVEKVIEQARYYGSGSVSSNWFTCWLVQAIFKWLPISWVVDDMLSGDQSNHNLVEALDKDFPLIKS
eukprot:CAMPEP_0197441336 /NCGR_PEP_ID=MMETSP1175-20131217/7627_1 /TAXON_ID=1003142 /ORGANISM="Triceratium dubium, Strain CCMP147" /LENGTH=451 /DNA_ID=CAMNT_0042971591 /DNA_START=100 /DNA_END=1455 /DNA_ORIENTATION=-